MIDVFTPWWFILLAIAVLGVVICKLTLKTEKAKKIFLVVAGCAIFVYLFAYKVALWYDPVYDMKPWDELPLNLCNIAAPLVVIAALTDNRPLKAYAFLNCTIGAIIAVIFSYPNFSNAPIFSARGIGYWGFHFAVIFLCINLVTLNVYTPRFKDLLWSVSLFLLSAAVAHGINLILRATVFPEANYFFTFGLQGNALADVAYNLLPIPLVWEVLMILPCAAVEALEVLLVRVCRRLPLLEPRKQKEPAEEK